MSEITKKLSHPWTTPWMEEVEQRREQLPSWESSQYDSAEGRQTIFVKALYCALYERLFFCWIPDQVRHDVK